MELAPLGIRVNALSPGITETPLTAKNPAAFAEAVANVPLGRAGQPADLAEAAYFLCSPRASFITGHQPHRRRRRVADLMSAVTTDRNTVDMRMHHDAGARSERASG